MKDKIALQLSHVTKIYTQWQRSGKIKDVIKNLFAPEKRELVALDDLSLTIHQGEFVAYAGANGAGKSTTIKILSGILQPSQGQVFVLGMNPAKQRIELMKRIGVLFGQRTELWWDHPVISSYEWKKAVWNISDEIYEKTLKEVVELLDLSDILHTFSRELSLGQRMRADLGMMLLHRPELIFLDEPTLGLDVLGKRQMIAFLKRIHQENKTTIVVTSHDMDDLEEMAERMILLSKGKIAFDGDFYKLREAQGACSRIQITVSGKAPVMEDMNCISSEKNVYEYEFDTQKMNMAQVLALLSKQPDIRDIEIKKAPIEEVIANLYLSWKQESINNQ